MVYRFAECELDERLYQLRREGSPVALEPKMFDVLAYLIQHRDRVVSKDELLDKLWPGQVVGENALTRCIRAARSAVGDDGVKQEIIATQHGRGYRFVATVTTIQPGVRSQEEESQKAKEKSQKPVLGVVEGAKVEETEKEKTQLNNGGLRTPDLQDPSSNSPVSSSQSLIPNTQSPALIHSWSSRSFMLAGVLLLVGIIVMVQYLSQPSLIPQSSALVAKEAQPPSLPLPDKPSIIVLPFVNLSGDPAQEYFSDGITEEITARLSQVSSLFVIARTSAFTYKGKGVKVQDISREMGVRYVLEGSVRKTDDQLRIIAQLIDATSGEHLWAEHYDRPLKDIFAVQDEIVQKIVTTLNLQLTLWEQGVLVRKRTNSLEAYDFYLRGVESMWRAAYEGKKELNAQAEQMFEKAIELDPQYAEAYAGLGSAKYNDWFYVWDSTHALEEAFQAEKTAIALDDSLPLAHSILGQVYLWRKQHEQAVNEARRAVALAPNDASSYAHLGNILTFAGGELNQAISLIERGMRLNPRYPPVYLVALAITYRVAGRCEEALAPLQRAAALAPNFIQARVNLDVCYVEVDRLPEAQAEVAEIRRINPGFSLAWMTQRLPFKDQAVIERMVAALRKAGLK